MPTLPVYNSNQNINASPNAPQLNQAAQPFNDVKQMVGTLQDVTQKWSDVNDTMQFTKAKANSSIAIAQQEALARNDPNPDNAPEHIKAIQDITTNSIQGISNQLVAAKASQEIQSDALVSTIKINSIFKQKQMLQNDMALQNTSDIAAQNFSNAITEAEKQHTDQNFITTINQNFNAGLITEQRAKGLIDNYRIGIVKSDMLKENATNLSQSNVLAELRKGNDGKYAALSTDQRTEADRLVRVNVRENAELQKEGQFSNETDMAMNIAKGNSIPSAAELAGLMQSGKITQDFAETTLKAVSNPQSVAATTDNQEFANLTEEMFKSNDKTNLNKTVQSIIRGGGDGKISKEDMQILIQSAMAQGKQPLLEKRNASTNTVTSLGSWADQSKLPRADVFREFQKQISQGSELSVASDAAKKKAIIDNIPGAANLTDVPNIIIDKDSTVRYIFPKKTIVYPNRIYNATSGKLEANPETHPSSK